MRYDVAIALCWIASTAVNAIEPAEEAQAAFYADRVQEWFRSEELSDADVVTTEQSLSEWESAVIDEDSDDDSSLNGWFFGVLRSAFWKVLWTSVGWSIGMMLPVCLLAAGVIYSRRARHKAQKIQERIINEQLQQRANRRRQAQTHFGMAGEPSSLSRSEITPYPS